MVGSAPAESPEANPLEGVKLFVDRETPAWQQWWALERSGQHEKAELIWKIAREPRAAVAGALHAAELP
jgi:hypothetical protein